MTINVWVASLQIYNTEVLLKWIPQLYCHCFFYDLIFWFRLSAWLLHIAKNAWACPQIDILPMFTSFVEWKIIHNMLTEWLFHLTDGVWNVPVCFHFATVKVAPTQSTTACGLPTSFRQLDDFGSSGPALMFPLLILCAVFCFSYLLR